MKDFFTDKAEPARKVVKKLTEGDIQKACVAYARGKGFWARKFSSPSQRSVPDYLFGKRFLVEDTTTVWETVKWAEEFKAPKKTSTEAQQDEQKLMTDAGWLVIADTGTNGQADIDAFKRRIDDMERQYGQ